MKKLEPIFFVCSVVSLGTWIFSEDYKTYGALWSIVLLMLISIYILLTSQEKLSRVFASVSLTVICAALGVAILRLSGLLS